MRFIAMLGVIGLALFIGGCGGVPTPPSQLVGPAKRCMVPAENLETLSVGDNLVAKYASTIKSYKRTKSKLACLQKWVRVVTKK